MGRMRKTAKPKTPTYERIDRKADPLEVYPLLDRCVKQYRPELADHDCRIALAWRHGLKRDKDGHLVLGKCKKVSDLDKQFAGFDFVVILNKDAWQEMDDAGRVALMHHELCHAGISLDQNGNPRKDARGRQMFRGRKHDIEEFGDVVALHGCYKQDLEQFVLYAIKSKRPPQPPLPLMGGDGAAEVPVVAGSIDPSANGHEPSANGHAKPRPVPAAAKNRMKRKAKA